MVHHLIGERSAKEQCIYCAKDLTLLPWRSDFHGEIHYKTLTCECGKEVRIRIGFHGSGHDSWDGYIPSEKGDHISETLEQTVKEDPKKG
ncbi:hypothetical protein JXB02_03015 [Candidatus Woesearchaeota archaeon]|nr:hypothetical protein [Candidatus Woesearchaeota archaeon]